MNYSYLKADLTNEEHGAAVLSLLDEYARGEMGGGASLSPFVIENLLRELGKREQVHVLLAYDKHQPIGLVIAVEGFSTFASRPLLNIHDVVVTESYRKRGIAKRLLAECEALGKQLGCCKLTLEVLEGNTIAQALYRQYGFEGYELDPKMGKAYYWQKKLL